MVLASPASPTKTHTTSACTPPIGVSTHLLVRRPAGIKWAEPRSGVTAETRVLCETGARRTNTAKRASRKRCPHPDVHGHQLKAEYTMKIKDINRQTGALLTLLTAIGLAAQVVAFGTTEQHWVASWACAPQLVEPNNLPPVPLANATLRQFVHTTLPGKQVRLRLSNAYGTEPVSIRTVHIALAAGTGSAGTGQIDPASDTQLTFAGATNVAIPPGVEITSDPAAFNLPPLTNIAISIHFDQVPRDTVTGHPGSRTTSFIVPGTNAVSEPTLPNALKTTRWYIITGLDVLTDSSSRAVVTLGDSLTDGRGSTTDGNDRWPDQLARRLATNPPTANLAVINMGIGGNAVLSGGLGPTARARFDRDVLGQPGVRYAIIFEGVNDIGTANATMTTATNLITAFTEFAQKAHARGLRIFCATITPFGGSFYYSPEREQIRQFLNSWIRTNTVFDAVLDFDAAVRDPVNPINLNPLYDTGDHLHLNPAGYRAIADTIDLSLFTE